MFRTGRRATRTAAGVITVRNDDPASARPAAARRRAARSRDDLDVLLPLRSTGGRPPLFCVHHSTGLSWCYAALLRHLPSDQPVYGLQARGLARSEALPDSIDEMAADYAEQLRAVQPTGPYQILGWSLGGLIGQAIATRLVELGEEVSLLALLDAVPESSLPHTPRAPGEPDGEAPGAPNGDARWRPADDGVGRAGDGRLQERLRRVRQRLGGLARRHVPRTFDGDALLFLATEDRPAELPLPAARTIWRPFVAGEIEAHDVAVDHHGMLRPAHVPEIGRLVTDRLRPPTGA
jgi:thioesterase domain-containing protein